VIVEEQYVGRDYRILVVGGKVVAVAERVPAQVVGDGKSTVAQLIEIVNQDPRRGVGHEQVMTRIVVDDHLIDMLAGGLELQIRSGERPVVTLRATANLSTGGTAIDRTDVIHPDNASHRPTRRPDRGAGRRRDRLHGARHRPLGARDRRRHRRGQRRARLPHASGAVRGPAARRGQGRDRHLFPPGARSRIPIVAVTGTNGKSTVVRMVARIAREMGKTVGLTNTSGVYINDERILAADASGPKSARMVLRDPTVDLAVLETARGGMLREGLAFDRCDVGIVLNVTADHLGLKGVDTWRTWRRSSRS
jgi:cyanophycin synthetase